MKFFFKMSTKMLKIINIVPKTFYFENKSMFRFNFNINKYYFNFYQWMSYFFFAACVHLFFN